MDDMAKLLLEMDTGMEDRSFLVSHEIPGLVIEQVRHVLLPPSFDQAYDDLFDAVCEQQGVMDESMISDMVKLDLEAPVVDVGVSMRKFKSYTQIMHIDEIMQSSIAPVFEDTFSVSITQFSDESVLRFPCKFDDRLFDRCSVLLVPSCQLKRRGKLRIFPAQVTNYDHSKSIIEIVVSLNDRMLNMAYTMFMRPYDASYLNQITMADRFMHDQFLANKIFGRANRAQPIDLFVAKRIEFMKEMIKSDTFMNDEQKYAVYSMILQDPKNAFVLFGPPGTGKTATLIEAIRHIRDLRIHNKPSKFLICAPTNMAADNFAKQLLKANFIKKVHIMRLLSAYLDVPSSSTSLAGISRSLRRGFYLTKEEINRHEVIISTLGCCHQLRSAGSNFFTHIMIDEAGQAVEPEIVVALGLYAGKTSRVVLAGDPKQLGPVIVNQILSNPKYAFDRSTLLRLSERPEYKRDPRLMVQLCDNHRSHQSIVEVASTLFYDGTLRPTKPRDHEFFSGSPVIDGQKIPIRFHCVYGLEVGDESYSNLAEVDVIEDYVRKILRTHQSVPPSEIGVITPYRDQVEKIRDRLCHITDLTVDTVEKFQGSERRVILFSAVRTARIGFVKDELRFNTAITRARQLLIVVGHPSLLAQSAAWERFMNYLKANNLFVNFHESVC